MDLMSLEEAIRLFIMRAKLPLDGTHDAAEEIVEELGYLPLAIEQTASYVRETKRPVEDYLKFYLRSRSDREQLHRWTPEGNRNYKKVIKTVWEESFNYIKEIAQCPVAVQLLQLLAFLNPDEIMLEFLAAGANRLNPDLRALIANEIKLDEALRLLERFSLIKRFKESKSVSIHRLVQDVIQHEFDDQHLFKQWDTIANVFIMAFPKSTDHHSLRHICRKYRTQVWIPLSKSPELASQSLFLGLGVVGRFLESDGKFIQASELFEKALAICTKIVGEQHPDMLGIMLHLAMTYMRLGRTDDALGLGLAGLDTSKEVLREQHPETLKTMHLLAIIYKELGRTDDALELGLAVLDTRKEALGERHPSTLRTMRLLAGIYKDLGRMEDAQEFELTVLGARKESHGEQYPKTIGAMHD